MEGIEIPTGLSADEKKDSYLYDKPLDQARANMVVNAAKRVLSGDAYGLGPTVYQDLPRVIDGIQAGRYGDAEMEQEVQALKEQLPVADITGCLRRLEANLEAGNAVESQAAYEISGLQFELWQQLGVTHEEGEMKALFERYQALAARVGH